jgi:outer membrane protein OmpA-like peptidoglycan-associated protein
MAATMAVSSVADAQVLHRFALRAELGAGTVLSSHQRTLLHYDTFHLQFSGRIAVNPVDWFSIQLSVINGLFFSSQDNVGLGRTLILTGGVRFEPMIGRVGRPWIDGNFGFTMTGADQRFGLDAGLGFEFQATSWLALGPAVRIHWVKQDPMNSYPQDALYWSGGLSLTLRPPADAPVVHEPIRVVDTDNDGVYDPDDLCVTVPAGGHPDRTRRGCPTPDTDRDRVFDDEDQCVNEPAGAHPDPTPTRRGCPDRDTDNDGVYDSTDQCVDVPAGEHPDTDRAGCPLPDRDGDTIVDPLDRCPDQPGAPNANPERNGCPGLVRIQNGMIQIMAPVYFATNRDVILPRSYPVLEAVVEAIRATPSLRRVSVEGHTDDVGNDARNLSLSQRRAWSVVEFVHEHGVEANRLRAQGFGETRPLRPIANLRGRALRDARAENRRVEFRIVNE